MAIPFLFKTNFVERLRQKIDKVPAIIGYKM